MISLHVPSLLAGGVIGLFAGALVALAVVFAVEESEEHKSARLSFSQGWDAGYAYGRKEGDQDV